MLLAGLQRMIIGNVDQCCQVFRNLRSSNSPASLSNVHNRFKHSSYSRKTRIHADKDGQSSGEQSEYKGSRPPRIASGGERFRNARRSQEAARKRKEDGQAPSSTIQSDSLGNIGFRSNDKARRQWQTNGPQVDLPAKLDGGAVSDDTDSTTSQGSRPSVSPRVGSSSKDFSQRRSADNLDWGIDQKPNSSWNASSSRGFSDSPQRRVGRSSRQESGMGRSYQTSSWQDRSDAQNDDNLSSNRSSFRSDDRYGRSIGGGQGRGRGRGAISGRGRLFDQERGSGRGLGRGSGRRGDFQQSSDRASAQSTRSRYDSREQQAGSSDSQTSEDLTDSRYKIPEPRGSSPLRDAGAKSSSWSPSSALRSDEARPPLGVGTDANDSPGLRSDRTIKGQQIQPFGANRGPQLQRYEGEATRGRGEEELREGWGAAAGRSMSYREGAAPRRTQQRYRDDSFTDTRQETRSPSLRAQRAFPETERPGQREFQERNPGFRARADPKFGETLNPQATNFQMQQESRTGVLKDTPSQVKQIMDSWKGDKVYGMNPVISCFQAQRRVIYRLYVQQGDAESGKGDSTSRLLALASERNVPVERLSKHDLNTITRSSAHQGVLIDCSSIETHAMNTFPRASSISPSEHAKPPIWLALDEVQDVQNFGAILRTAHFLGLSGVVTCTRNSAPLTAAVSKASAGALEHMLVRDAAKLQHTLADAKAKGWRVIGAQAGPKAVNCMEISITGPTILVVGSEGKGLRTTVQSACTDFIQISSGLDPEENSTVDSLNVSVATGILAHQLLSQAEWLGTASLPKDNPKETSPLAESANPSLAQSPVSGVPSPSQSMGSSIAAAQPSNASA